MKYLVSCLILAAGVILFSTSSAEADHRHYRGCGHSGYSYRSYDRYDRGYYPYRRSYRPYSYGYRSQSYYRPVPVYRDYWHDHYYRGSSYRCHYYSGRHYYNYRPYYRPRSSFHFGISIFR